MAERQMIGETPNRLEHSRDGVYLGEWDGGIGPWVYGDWDAIAQQGSDDGFGRTGTNKASWCHGYVSIYEQLLRHRSVKRLLELGVYKGDSLAFWHNVFPDAEVVGVDVNRMPDVPGTTQILGDVSDPNVVAAVSNGGRFDVIVDDCTHQLADILLAFDLYAPGLADDGIYIIEDTFLDENPWYGTTADVVEGLRARNYSPVVIVPGRRWVFNGEDRGLWALVVVTP